MSSAQPTIPHHWYHQAISSPEVYFSIHSRWISSLGNSVRGICRDGHVLMESAQVPMNAAASVGRGRISNRAKTPPSAHHHRTEKAGTPLGIPLNVLLAWVSPSQDTPVSPRGPCPLARARYESPTRSAPRHPGRLGLPSRSDCSPVDSKLFRGWLCTAAAGCLPRVRPSSPA